MLNKPIRRNAAIAMLVAIPVSVKAITRMGIMPIFLALSFYLTSGCTISKGLSPQENLIVIQKGDIPIVLSAPHGGRNPIPGVSTRDGKKVTRQFVTQRDANTLELTKSLSQALEKRFGAKPYMIIARFDRKYLDVNRRPDEAYESENARPYYDAYHRAVREACQQVCRKWKYGLFLDIHGQASRSDAIFRGTRDGKTVSELLARFGKAALTGPQSIFGQLEKRGYVILPANDGDEKEYDRYHGGYIVKTLNAQTGIDAIQLEIGRHLRAEDRSDKTAADLADAIEIFAKAYMITVQNAK